jgi:hypothetical protein
MLTGVCRGPEGVTAERAGSLLHRPAYAQHVPVCLPSRSRHPDDGAGAAFSSDRVAASDPAPPQHRCVHSQVHI